MNSNVNNDNDAYYHYITLHYYYIILSLANCEKQATYFMLQTI